jgi:hypothetical protein
VRLRGSLNEFSGTAGLFLIELGIKHDTDQTKE